MTDRLGHYRSIGRPNWLKLAKFVLRGLETLERHTSQPPGRGRIGHQWSGRAAASKPLSPICSLSPQQNEFSDGSLVQSRMRSHGEPTIKIWRCGDQDRWDLALT